MTSLRVHIIVSIVLGVLALAAGLLSWFALTDIHHRKADVTLEWGIVRLSAVVILAFILSAMLGLGRMRRQADRAFDPR